MFIKCFIIGTQPGLGLGGIFHPIQQCCASSVQPIHSFRLYEYDVVLLAFIPIHESVSINIRNKVGTYTEPCGTPALRSYIVDCRF